MSASNYSKVGAQHHYFSRTYLRGFVENGRLSVWRRADGSVLKNQSPDNVAHIKGFYTFTDKDGNLSDDLENEFANIESRATSTLRNLDSLFPPRLEGATKEVVASFIALQYLRTPEKRYMLEQATDLLYKLEMIVQSNKDLADNKKSFDKGKLKSLSEFIDNPHALRITGGKEQLLGLQFDNLSLVYNLLMFRRWDLVVFDEPSLILGDCPFMFIPYNSIETVGLENAKEIRLALSAKCLLVMSHQDYKIPKIIRGIPGIAAQYNIAQIYSSWTDVFGPPSIISKYDGVSLGNRPCMSVSTGFMPEFFEHYNKAPDNPRSGTR